MNQNCGIAHRRIRQKAVEHNGQIQKWKVGNLFQQLPVFLRVYKLIYYCALKLPVICEKVRIKSLFKTCVLTALQNLIADSFQRTAVQVLSVIRVHINSGRHLLPLPPDR